MRLTLISLLLIAGNFISAQVEVSEINYNSDSTLNSGNWVELHNKGNTNINLTGWIITDSKPTHIFTFPLNQNLAPGEYLVVTDDTIKFKNIHPAVTNFIGEVPFGLSNNSDTITIYDNNGTIVYNMAYWDSSPWQKTADGMGRTLELRNSAADPALPESWFAGCIGGSPGLAYSPCDDPIVVTEINYHSLPQLDSRDWAELHNRTLSAIDISGWQLKDKTDTNFYIFPTGSIIPADGYLVAVTDTPFFKSIYPTVTNFDENMILDSTLLNSQPTSIAGPTGANPLISTMQLYDAVPNPAAGETSVSYYLPETSSASLEIYDLSGRLVKTQNVPGNPGLHSVSVNTSELANGDYLISLLGSKGIKSKHLIIAK